MGGAPLDPQITQNGSKTFLIVLKRSESIEHMGTAIPENMSRIGALWRLTELEIHPNPGFRLLPSVAS